ncbi:probable elongation factor 1-gamma [Ctenocephalides felis]|uniref:probable elongation factor 1-gamma n=1 Tax=Ctenocephalides felis TaxID=7515 RepID=UPI000E6E4DC3|nr:probable elongation factor 1-gamma [Ctenocephalides felis]
MDIDVAKHVALYYRILPEKLKKVDNVLTYTSSKNGISKGFIGSLLALAEDSLLCPNTTNPNNRAEIMQWLEYCALFVLPAADNKMELNILKDLDHALKTKSYLLGETLSLADIVMFYSIGSLMHTLNNSNKFLHVARWYDHLQKNDAVSQGRLIINFNSLFI